MLSIEQTYPLQKRHYVAIYILLLLMVVVALGALPLLSTTISTRATGITRPAQERTTIKAIQSGIIDSIYFMEGAIVQQGATILNIKDFTGPAQMQYNAVEAGRRSAFIQDLRTLSLAKGFGDATALRLQTPLYREQLNRFLNQMAGQQATLDKANRELELNTRLWKERVISDKEYFDYQNAQRSASAAYKAFEREQKSAWLQQLAQYESESAQYRQQQKQAKANTQFYKVKAPTSGVVQNINTLYSGGTIQAGDDVCSISPESSLIAECYVSTRDIGLLQNGQAAIFQIDAFDYNYFGTLRGKILSIDNDYTIVDNQPVFKVRCSFDSTQLQLKNGFTSRLKKGLTLQARFVVAERTVWQLLFDKVDDWLNPAAPQKNTNI